MHEKEKYDNMCMKKAKNDSLCMKYAESENKYDEISSIDCKSKKLRRNECNLFLLSYNFYLVFVGLIV